MLVVMSPKARPLAILAVTSVVIASSYVVAFRTGILDPLGGTMVTPPISLLLFDGPARWIGQFGFLLVSVLFATCVPPLRDGLRLALRDEPQSFGTAALISSACVAFCALAIVGAVPLQRNICEVMLGRAKLDSASAFHQSFAGVFFLAAAAHMALWLKLAVSVSGGCPISWRVLFGSFCFKLGCFVCFWLPLPAAFILHPASPLRRRLELTDSDAGGVQQYALVGTVALFFASYTVEFAAFERLHAAAAAEKGR